MKELNILVNKSLLSLEEQIKLIKLKDDLDRLYINMTKGAFVHFRAKWSRKVRIIQAISLP